MTQPRHVMMGFVVLLSSVIETILVTNELIAWKSLFQDQVNEESVTETRPEDCCEDISPKSVMSYGLAEPGNDDRLVDPESSKKPEHAQQADHSIDAQPDYLDSGKIVKSQSKVKITSKKRRRKPNSSVKSSEPSDQVDSDKHAERTEDRPSDEPSVGVAVPSENEKENILLSSPKALAGEAVNVASPLPSGGISDGGRPKKAGLRKKKENFIQELSLSTDVSMKSSEVAIDTEVKPHKRSRKKVRAGGTSGEKTPTLVETFTSEDGTASDSEAKPLKQLGKKVVRDSIGEGFSSKKEDGKKHGRDKVPSEKDVTKAATKDGAKEVVSSPKTASKLAKGEGLPKVLSKRKRTAGKGRSNGPIESDNYNPATFRSEPDRWFSRARSLDAMEYGANLVGAKVKVWWPDDEMFYEGVVTSFYSDEKKHTVSYTDNDVEVLNLRAEKWEFSDLMPDGEQATECQSPDPSPEMHRKKKAKTNSKSEAKRGKMEGSRGGETSLSKLKGSASKSGRISKSAPSKSDGKAEDDNGGKKSKDPLPKSKISVASSTPGKSKDVDGGAPKTSAKSKQETPKTAIKNSPRTSTKSKDKGSKSGGTSNANGYGKAKSASGKGKESKGNEKSPEIVKTPEEDAKKSGKKRQRGAKS
ncbi:hypothetical protein RHMOL_Rhmol07G0210500 [Rhododendron molle]|uniref:Uncharacterized protein n=1 Tax=Rhododendron molle TaxID=49168 RepID=A0ACC0N392_RHOML|nr:hypothetical protein RHMOL_Rhmol07G0210500 [Rhododendron molle]